MGTSTKQSNEPTHFRRFVPNRNILSLLLVWCPATHKKKLLLNGNKNRSNEELQNEEGINSSQPGVAQRQQVHDFVQQRTEQQQPGRINYCRRSIVTRQGSDYQTTKTNAHVALLGTRRGNINFKLVNGK